MMADKIIKRLRVSVLCVYVRVCVGHLQLHHSVYVCMCVCAVMLIRGHCLGAYGSTAEITKCYGCPDYSIWSTVHGCMRIIMMYWYVCTM